MVKRLKHFSKEEVWMANRHIKRFSTLLNHQQNENQKQRYPVKLVRMHTIKNLKVKCWQGCKEIGILKVLVRCVNWYKQLSKQYGGSPKKLKTELS